MCFFFVLQKEEVKPAEKEVKPKESSTGFPVDLSHEDYYFPSVDLLTAQVHTHRKVVSISTSFVLLDFQVTKNMLCQFSVTEQKEAGLK